MESSQNSGSEIKFRHVVPTFHGVLDPSATLYKFHK